MTTLMPWILKALLVLVKTRKGREILFAVGLGAIELAQGERAQKLYSKVQATVNDPAVRQRVTQSARRVVRTIRR